MSNVREIDVIEMLEKRHNFSREDSKMLTEFLQDKSVTKEDLKITEIKLDSKIEGVKKDLEAKIDGVEQRLEAKIDSIRKDLEATEQRLEAKIDGVEQRLEAKIDGVEQRLEAKIDKEVGFLKEDIRELKTDMSWIKILGGGIIVGVFAQIFISLFM